MDIKQVAVIGAGVMGAAIAAHVANAGVPVILLDLPVNTGSNRNALADQAVQRMLGSDPAPFMHKRNARLIRTGNLEDDMGLLGEVDWIIEAVIERLDVKRGLYARLEQVRRPGSIVSSNTSTIPLAALGEHASDAFRQDFLISHFFNPPRYMRLLELVCGPRTRAEAACAVSEFCDQRLGKGVVQCNDTPGFIGNRIGVYWLQCAVAEAISMQVPIEEVDAVLGTPVGVPRTGIFGLIDLVGLDLVPQVMASLDASLPADDAMREYLDEVPLVKDMIARGYTGRKGKGGFYRLNTEGGQRVKESIDLQTGRYAPSTRPRLACVEAADKGGLRALFENGHRSSQYAWRVLSRTLCYAASLVPEIADDIVSVDEAMRLGYSWQRGPFQLLDAIGVQWFVQRLEHEGTAIPALLRKAGSGFYRADSAGEKTQQYLDVSGRYKNVRRASGVIWLSDFKRTRSPLAANSSASLWDIDDGVLCLEFHAKMNALDPQVLALIDKTIQILPREHRALVVYNEAENFSVGVNLGLALFALNIAAWDEVQRIVAAGQNAYKALKYAPFPVVGAPSGMALGGGCEMLLHCDAVVAHAETYMGLVETGVGLVPGWGGCKELLARWYNHAGRPSGPMSAIAKVFEIVSVATVARSAQQAGDYLFLRDEDEIVMNRDRVLAHAKTKAQILSEAYTPPEPPQMQLPGPSARAAMQLAVHNFRLLGKATAYDAVVADGLAEVLSGGDTDITNRVDEDMLLALERKVFMRLARNAATQARVEHMLETGRALRN